MTHRIAMTVGLALLLACRQERAPAVAPPPAPVPAATAEPAPGATATEPAAPVAPAPAEPVAVEPVAAASSEPLDEGQPVAAAETPAAPDDRPHPVLLASARPLPRRNTPPRPTAEIAAEPTEATPGTEVSPAPAQASPATPAPEAAPAPAGSAPPGPAQLTATALGETEVELRWSATPHAAAAGYEVLRDGRVIAGGPALAAREKALRPYTEYCYAVRAIDAAGHRSAPSAPACARTKDLVPPSTPQHLVASATSDRSVQVLWQASSDNAGVAKYELVRDGDVVAEPDGAWAEETDLHPGVRYCYAVRAVDGAGNRSPVSATACAVTPDQAPPSVPDAVAAQPVSTSAMYVAWQPSIDDVGVTGYEIVRDGEVTSQVTGTDVFATGLAAGRHCFRVRAVDAAGNRSALSSAICGTTTEPGTPPAPFRLRAEPASEKAVRLSWHPSSKPGVVYRIYWDDGKSIGATRLTDFSAVGLKPGERHCYRVGAVDDGGHESPRTLEACAASRTESLSSR